MLYVNFYILGQFGVSSLKGSSESILVKMPHCWKSHITAHFEILVLIPYERSNDSDKSFLG